MFLVLGLVGLVSLLVAMARGAAPYPFGIKAEKNGENPGLFWMHIAIAGAFVAFGLIDLVRMIN